MATIFILTLFILVIWLLIIKHAKSGLAILILAITSFIAIGSGLLPAILLKQLQIPYTDVPEPLWKNKNAIVLLGAGTISLPGSNPVIPAIMAYSRITKAANLYFSCVKNKNTCTIVISGGDALKTGKSEAIVYRDMLSNLGIRTSDIILEPNSMNTYKNAEFTSSILKRNKFDKVILVTSAIHLKRALLYFSHFGIYPEPAFADYLTSEMSILPLGYNFAMTDFAIHEYLGIMRFHIYNFLRLNKQDEESL